MKNKLIVTALILVATMCVSLMSGCWVDSARIEFVEYPAATYYKDAPASALTFSIRDMDSKEVFNYNHSAPTAGITVDGFSTAKVGSFTATVTMGDYSLEFDYEVIDNTGFAGGDGSMANPYQIANPAQFQNMLNDGVINSAKEANAKTYYKLIADIDLDGVVIKQTSSEYTANVEGDPTVYYKKGIIYFNGILEGNGYKVKNIGEIVCENNPNEKLNELFGVVGPDFALKNIEFNFAASGEKACTGLTSTVAEVTSANVVFDHVTTTGYIDLANRCNTSIGVFMAQAGRHGNKTTQQITIKDCVNNTSIYNGSTCDYIAGFIHLNGKLPLAFENNTYGAQTIEGGKVLVAALVSNVHNVMDSAKIKNNTVGTTNIIVVDQNAATVSGAYAAGTAAGVAGYTATSSATITEVTGAQITKTDAGSIVLPEIPANITKVRIAYSGEYADGGGLFFSRMVDVVDLSNAVLLMPELRKASAAASENAVMFESVGVWMEGNVVYINKARDVQQGLQVMLIGFAGDKVVWSTNNITLR